MPRPIPVRDAPLRAEQPHPRKNAKRYHKRLGGHGDSQVVAQPFCGKPLEICEFPNDYAHRFDSADLGGNNNPDRLKGLTQDMDDLAKVRMQQELIQALLVTGSGNATFFSAGARFKLTDHFNLNGEYLLLNVSHAITQAATGGFTYQNGFSCIPFSTQYPYRPPRATPKPFIPGTQTATVITSAGAKNEELFIDRFGRVKVLFHWDRDTKDDPAKHSCWVRVAQIAAGKNWGASFWPRVGQEVVVSFLEGNPDLPLIVGVVYNYVQPPPYLGDSAHPSPDPKHPNDPNLSGIKTNTTLGGVGFNELRFDDTKDKQQVFVHAERNMDVRVKNDSMERVIGNRHLISSAGRPRTSRAISKRGAISAENSSTRTSTCTSCATRSNKSRGTCL